MGFRHVVDSKGKLFCYLFMFLNGRVVDDVAEFMGLVAKSAFLFLEGGEVGVPPSFGVGARFPDWYSGVDRCLDNGY